MTADLLEETLAGGEDDVRHYLQQIRRYPRLTAQEERELAKLCAEGDEDAIRQMVSSNLRLVVSVAREYAGRGVPLMDLVQEGSIGLLVAAKKFDYTLEYKFSTYATKWIRQGISRCLMNHGLIRVPGHTQEKIRKVQMTQKRLLQENGTEPVLRQIAEQCDMTEETVKKLLSLDPQVCSLDTPMGEDEEGYFGQLLENTHAPQPYEKLVRDELGLIIHGLMDGLNDRQRYILRLRHGMEDGNCYSLEQVGNILGISKERARQLEKQAMEKMRAAGSEIGLEDFLE